MRSRICNFTDLPFRMSNELWHSFALLLLLQQVNYSRTFSYFIIILPLKNVFNRSLFISINVIGSIVFRFATDSVKSIDWKLGGFNLISYLIRSTASAPEVQKYPLI